MRSYVCSVGPKKAPGRCELLLFITVTRDSASWCICVQSQGIYFLANQVDMSVVTVQKTDPGGPRVAPSVQLWTLAFSSGHHLMVRGIESLGFSLPLSLPLLHSLSQIHLKNNNNNNTPKVCIQPTSTVRHAENRWPLSDPRCHLGHPGRSLGLKVPFHVGEGLPSSRAPPPTPTWS